MTLFEKLRHLGKDTALYGLGDALQKLINFLLFPVYARFLSKADFGLQDLILTTVIVISSILVLGLDSAAARHYYDAELPDEKRNILSTWLWFELLLSIPVTLLLVLLAKPICSLIFDDPSLSPYFCLGIASLPFALVAGVSMLTLRLTFQAKAFSILSASGVLIHGLAAIYFVVILGKGVMGVFVAYIFASVARAILGMLLTYKHFRYSLSKSWLKPMLYFGVPLVPASLFIWVFNYSNRYFVLHFSTLEEVGIFSVGSRVSSILLLITLAFQTAWGPFAFSLIKDEALAKRTYSTALSYFLLLSLSFTVCLSVFARETVLLLATQAYERAAPLVSFLCYGFIAWGAYYIVGTGAAIAKKSYHVTIATLLAATITCLMNYLFIPRFGIIAAAFSTMFGNFAALLYGFYTGQHHFTVPYDYKKLFLLLTSATCAITVGALIDYSSVFWLPSLLPYKLLLICGFVASLFLFRVITTTELRLVLTYLPSFLPRNAS